MHKIDLSIETLLNERRYHIEFNGHLTNHVKHAVIALNGLGVSPHAIKSYYENYIHLTPYGYAVEKARPSQHTITENNWKIYLGKRTSFSSYYDFFDQKEKELGLQKLLETYLPTLLEGWAGSLTHGTIHLGWALDIRNRCMIIEGLAYMAFSYVSCFPQRAKSSSIVDLAHQSALNTLLHIAKEWSLNASFFQQWVENIISEPSEHIHPELARSGLQYKIAKILTTGHPLIYSSITWIEHTEIEDIWAQLHYVTTLIYMLYPGDFLLLHLLTSLHAMEYIAKNLPLSLQKYVAQCFWIGMLCILFSRGIFPNVNTIESVHNKYNHLIDADHLSVEKEWTKFIIQASADPEEHNAKLVYVLKRMWTLSKYQSIFRIAAQFFTTTPQLPSSFEKPPIE